VIRVSSTLLYTRSVHVSHQLEYQIISVGFLSGFLLYVVATDAYGVEYYCSIETSTAVARIGVLDYLWLFSLIFSILLGRYWC
jgi:hypothetical protein